MKKEESIAFWTSSSDRDCEAMEHLFEKRDYSWSLFVGHLVIEKLLKAYYIKFKDDQPPFTHSLVRLAQKSGADFSDDQIDNLAQITTFNIQARYDDHKQNFYKVCTKDFTSKWLNEIKHLRKWLKEQLSK